MPARVAVYCRKSASELTVESLRQELDGADLYTLAECLDLPSGEVAAVDAMKPHLRLDSRPGAFSFVEVHWKPEHWPIQIERCFGASAQGELEETLEEQLPESETAGAKRVRKHLQHCTEIVHFRMVVPDSLDLAATLTEVLAFYIAEQCDGLVWFYHRDWAAPDDRGENIWVTS